MGTTPEYNIPYPELTDLPNVPLYIKNVAEGSEAAINTRALTKQDKPTDGTTMLTFAPGQSNNPVTVWGAAQNTTNNPSNGQNIQLQWANIGSDSVPSGYRLRAHIDARAGQPGQRYEDIAWASRPRLVNYGVFGYAVSTNVSVATSSINGNRHDIHLGWISGRVRAHVDISWVGDFAYVSDSTKRVKDIDENAPDADVVADFVRRLQVRRFRYKRDRALVSDTHYGREHLGFIAEDVHALAQELGLPQDMVEYDDKGRPKALKEMDLIAALWSTVQQMSARSAELESRVDALTAQVEDLQRECAE